MDAIECIAYTKHMCQHKNLGNDRGCQGSPVDLCIRKAILGIFFGGGVIFIHFVIFMCGQFIFTKHQIKNINIKNFIS